MKKRAYLEAPISICGDSGGHHEREVVSSRGAHRRQAFKLQGAEADHQINPSAGPAQQSVANRSVDLLHLREEF